jgi:hypothetical protein
VHLEGLVNLQLNQPDDILPIRSDITTVTTTQNEKILGGRRIVPEPV